MTIRHMALLTRANTIHLRTISIAEMALLKKLLLKQLLFYDLLYSRCLINSNDIVLEQAVISAASA